MQLPRGITVSWTPEHDLTRINMWHGYQDRPTCYWSKGHSDQFLMPTGVWTSAILRTLVSPPCNAAMLTASHSLWPEIHVIRRFVHMVSEWDSLNSRPLRYWDDSHQDAYISRDQLTGVCLIHVSEEVTRRRHLYLNLLFFSDVRSGVWEIYLSWSPLNANAGGWSEPGDEDGLCASIFILDGQWLFFYGRHVRFFRSSKFVVIRCITSFHI